MATSEIAVISTSEEEELLSNSRQSCLLSLELRIGGLPLHGLAAKLLDLHFTRVCWTVLFPTLSYLAISRYENPCALSSII